MTTTVPAPGTPAAVRGATPKVAQVIDHDTYSVVIDYNSPELWRDLVRTLRDRPRVAAELHEAVTTGRHDASRQRRQWLENQAVKHLTDAMGDATTWTLRPADADQHAEDVTNAAMDPGLCRITYCANYADNDIDDLCADHLEGRQ